MSKTYLPYDPDQQLLLPQALQEWLPEDHLAYFISDVVDQLDLAEITTRYEGERRPALPSSDDGEGAAVRLLRWGAVIAAHCHQAARGHRLPSAGGEQHAGLAPSRTFARTTWRRS